ncbi:phage-like protein [Enterobacter kobei]|uniref:hypothetical protein n=1 Tax=Enterobacter kobei TaxID=208224 RepID=UPI0007CA1842|nr:hypothetical protein [Enterobacter kobei]SAZ56679.1 phage-like protein [Enterobacter kobei]
MKMVIQFCRPGALHHVSEQLNSAILFCQPVIKERGGEIMTPVYDLVRRADGKTFSVSRPAAAIWWTRQMVFSRCAPLWTTSHFTVESAARFLRKIGYQVIPPAA